MHLFVVVGREGGEEEGGVLFVVCYGAVLQCEAMAFEALPVDAFLHLDRGVRSGLHISDRKGYPRCSPHCRWQALAYQGPAGCACATLQRLPRCLRVQE